jgi:hypothetical protein
MRAVRALHQTTARELLYAATGSQPTADEPPPQERVAKLHKLLRTVRPATLYHALLARLPAECDMPHAHTKRTLTGYSAWLDALLAGGGGGDDAGAPGCGALFVDEAAWRRVDATVREVALACVATWQERGVASGSRDDVLARPEVALVRDFDPLRLPTARAAPGPAPSAAGTDA